MNRNKNNMFTRIKEKTRNRLNGEVEVVQNDCTSHDQVINKGIDMLQALRRFRYNNPEKYKEFISNIFE